MNESQIFAGALTLASATERAAFLDEVCAGNPRLRADVEALLRAHLSDPGFLEAGPPSASATGTYPTDAGSRVETVVGRGVPRPLTKTVRNGRRWSCATRRATVRRGSALPEMPKHPGGQHTSRSTRGNASDGSSPRASTPS